MSCKSEQKHPPTDDELVLSEEFASFYDRFHADSTFQMGHIIFPLTGVPSEIENRSDSFTWKREHWVLHRPFDDMDGAFTQNFYDINSVVIEKITHATGSFDMERRWTKIGNEYHLIYYKEMGR